MKKIGKAIARKFKNWKTTTSKETTIQKPKVSSSAAEKVSEDTVETTIEQQVVTIPAKEYSKEVHEVCKYSVTNKGTTHAIDRATETDTKLCNINSEDLQPISESSEEAQIETTIEPTSVDREINEQKPNPAEIELCFTIDEKDKPPTKTTQQRQAILAGVVGAILLASGVALYIMKMPVVAAVVGIVGLACIGLALYDALKPGTKLEKVEDVEQPAHSPLKTI